jgi:hypothetical protein
MPQLRGNEPILGLNTEAPMLISPDYSKDFLIFSFASFDTVAIVLL